MFEDQTVELLPARTTMKDLTVVSQSFNYSEAVAVNAHNVNVDGHQANIAAAISLAGSNVFVHH